MKLLNVFNKSGLIKNKYYENKRISREENNTKRSLVN